MELCVAHREHQEIELNPVVFYSAQTHKTWWYETLANPLHRKAGPSVKAFETPIYSKQF